MSGSFSNDMYPHCRNEPIECLLKFSELLECAVIYVIHHVDRNESLHKGFVVSCHIHARWNKTSQRRQELGVEMQALPFHRKE